MAEIDPGIQNPESRVILIDQKIGPVEIKPRAVDGAGELFAGLTKSLIAAIKGGLFETSPFIPSQIDPTTPAPEKSIEAPKAPTSTNRQHTLELAQAAYRGQLYNPQRLFEFSQAYWDYLGIELMGLSERDTRVADVPYKEEEIWEFMKLGNPQAGNPGADLAYFHLPVLASADKNTRVLFSKGFPCMNSWVFEPGCNLSNGHTISGWMRVDASLDAPFRTNKQGKLTGLNEKELNEAIKDAGRVGQTINIFSASGVVIKMIHGDYPDQSATWSRMPGSSRVGRVLSASFSESGLLGVHSRLRSGYRLPSVGGRSFLGANKT